MSVRVLHVEGRCLRLALDGVRKLPEADVGYARAGSESTRQREEGCTRARASAPPSASALTLPPTMCAPDPYLSLNNIGLAVNVFQLHCCTRFSAINVFRGKAGFTEARTWCVASRLSARGSGGALALVWQCLHRSSRGAGHAVLTLNPQLSGVACLQVSGPTSGDVTAHGWADDGGVVVACKSWG